MSNRYADLVRHLREATLSGAGVTDPLLRQAVEARAARLGGRIAGESEVPSAVAAFVEKVAQHAFTITNADVAALRQSGYSEDALFEITASAALGAGLGRLERGLAALRGEI
jgi:hypothetical protein